jgi:hypothetical protein
MACLFPYSLPKGLQLGRQEIHAVAEQRKHDIARFLESLFSLNISISQSDLVYTFFHPLLRDQQDADIHLRKLRGIPFFSREHITFHFIHGTAQISRLNRGQKFPKDIILNNTK